MLELLIVLALVVLGVLVIAGVLKAIAAVLRAGDDAIKMRPCGACYSRIDKRATICPHCRTAQPAKQAKRA